MRSIIAIAAVAVMILTTAAAAEQVKPKEGKPVTGQVVAIETDKGMIKFALYEKDAPITTKNFIELVNRKFYDGLKFHRVVPEFVIQGGDPKGDGTGNSEKMIKLEVSPKLKHDAAGVVAMARKPDPDSASCQFYITLGPAPFLDMNYAVFGRVTEGLDVVKKIEIGDVMKTVRIVDAPKPGESKPKDAENGKTKQDPKSDKK